MRSGDPQHRLQHLQAKGLSVHLAGKLAECTSRAAVDRAMGSMTADEREAADKALSKLASEAWGG